MCFLSEICSFEQILKDKNGYGKNWLDRPWKYGYPYVGVIEQSWLFSKGTDILFIMVSDDQAIRELFQGNAGLLRTKVTGRVIVNMSTVSPGISKEMAALCRLQGNDYLDAPVSGSVKQAEEGQLVIMVGGNEAAFQIAKPVLVRLGKLVLLVGDTGSGNSAKLAINTLLGIYAQGLSESIVFARKQGLKTEDLLTLINNSALGNVFGKIKGEAIIQDNYKAAFALKHITKDLPLAKAEGLNTPLGIAVQETFQMAEASFGNEDIIAVMKQVEQI